MAKKKQILKRNFYFKADGSIEFRKMIRGDLITGRTGMTDPHKVNKQADDIRHKFIADYYKLEKEKVKQPSFNILLPKWIETLHGKSPNTIRTYKSNVNHYINKGLPTHRSKSRVNGVRRDYNIFARWCNKKGYEVEILKGKTESEARTRVLNKEERESLFKVLYPKDFKDCIMFIYYTGCRRKEAMSPKDEWLRKNDRGDYYLEVIKKGGYKRIIRISEQALSILKNRDMKFWSYSDQHLTRRYRYFAKKVGIGDTQLHDLRRTFGYELLVSGKDIAIVARLLGISIKVAYKHYTPLLVSEIDNFTL